LALVSLLTGNRSLAQPKAVYNLPDSYHFDYEVTQALVHKRNTTDTSIMHFFYTKSGDYAALRIGRKENMKGNLFIVLTRDGNSIIFDEHKKNITVISIRKLLSDLSGVTKWIRMDSLLANLREKPDGKHFQSEKTGKTKQVGSYTSEEYSVSDNKGHHGSVWLASVDFNTPGDYILGVVGANLLKMMSDRQTAHPLPEALTKPRTLITAIDLRDSADGKIKNMYTLSINQTPSTVSTMGYQVDNYSNMTLPEIFQAEMKKKNN
jgi:hypothetical protein